MSDTTSAGKTACRRRHTNSCPYWTPREGVLCAWDDLIIDNCGNCAHYSREEGRCLHRAGNEKALSERRKVWQARLSSTTGCSS